MHKIDTLSQLQWLADQAATFALPSGRTKDRMEKDWPNKPHSITDALAHARQGGNTSLLVGHHSKGIIAIDRDVDYKETLLMLGKLANTVKVERTNAPDRGKLLYRVTGAIPPSTVWKLPGDQHPRCELLSNKRHALIPASEYDGGQYILRDMEAGILELTTEQLEHLWWLITGEPVSGKKHNNSTEHKDDFKERVKSAWATIDVFRHFDKYSEATDNRGGDVRLLGNGGLLLNDWRWYCHADEAGGDQIDAWHWCKHGTRLDRGDKAAFQTILSEMASAAGVERPQFGTNGHGKERKETSLLEELATIEGDEAMLKTFALDSIEQLAQMPRADYVRFTEALKQRGVAAEWLRTELRPAVNEEARRKQNGVTWLDYVKAANDLGYEFRLNVLDDSVEVNGQRMTGVIDAVLLSHLHAKGLRSADVARRAFTTDADSNHFHPVKQYLESLQWDGDDQIAGLSRHFTDGHDLITYANGKQRTVIHAWLRHWLIGNVAKVYNSQEAQNPMLVVDGVQGKGKSFLVKWLCSPLPHLHFEGSIRPEDKDYLRYLSTRWIWEVSELGATMRKADREALKSFITLQDVTYRPAHGEFVLNKPALASFVGTVNFEGALLNDPTGHRRFMPVEITSLDWDYTKNIDVNQVWAQAYHLYQRGTPWKLTEEEKQVHKAICEHYEVEDVLEGHLREWFKIEPDNEALFSHTTTIIGKLNTYAGARPGRATEMQLAATLNKIGLRKRKKDNRWGYAGIEFIEPTSIP